MLLQKLLSATSGGVLFVGKQVNIGSALVTGTTISLNALSGGIGGSAQAGDVVILAVGLLDATDRTFTASGYTKIADLYQSNVYTSQLSVFYKVLTTNDANATVNWGGPTDTIQKYVGAAHVWRGVNTTTPLDATATTWGSILNSIPDPASITTVTNGAVVLAIGTGASGSGSPMSALSAPSGMENFASGMYSTETGLGIAAVIRPTAGAYNPPVFGGGNSSSAGSNNSVTVALRPA